MDTQEGQGLVRNGDLDVGDRPKVGNDQIALMPQGTQEGEMVVGNADPG